MGVDRQLVQLGDVVDVITGFPFKSVQYSKKGVGIRLLRGDNIVQGTFRWDSVKFWPESEITEKHNIYWLKENDVVLAMDRPWIEAGLKTAQITKNDLPCLLVQRVASLRAKDVLNQNYLRYLISSYWFVEYIKQVQTGTAVPHISPTQIKSYQFLLPSLKEQEQIGNLLRTLDDKIELNRRMNETLEAMAQALFKSWFVDFDPVIDNALAADNDIPEALQERAAARQALGDKRKPLPEEIRKLFPGSFVFSDELGWIPEGWEAGVVEDIISRTKVKKRYKKKDVLEYGKTPVYEQGSNILLGYHNNEPDVIASMKKPAFIFGDHTCITKLSVEPFSISQNVIPLEGKKFNTVWVYYAVRDKQFFEEYRRHWMEFIIKPVIMPSSSLADCFNQLLIGFLPKQMSNSKNVSYLARLRDTVLPKLLSGELRIPDAEKLIEEAV